ncbi:MAG: hypothetical protein AMXMBFR72_25170 [Betaproteobacteria bacterium]
MFGTRDLGLFPVAAPILAATPGRTLQSGTHAGLAAERAQ